MNLKRLVLHTLVALLSLLATHSMATAKDVTKLKIILIAGEITKIDTAGHHDYLAGCECLQMLLRQTPGVETVRVNDGWPQDENIFSGASSIVFYTDGGGKQAFLDSPQRVAKLQSLVDAGVGIVMIHQAVDFPDTFAEQGRNWLGGVYQKVKSGRGHWPSSHIDFPSHPVTNGVTPWQINDGWLNGIQFVENMQGVTPLVWSGKGVEESRAGLDNHIVAWAYDRPAGGRSFSFTGLDAHSAWELPGMRQLVVNGVLWSAGVSIPENGALNAVEESTLDAMTTPRESKKSSTAASKKP